MEFYVCNNSNELTHWGIKGMKWGVRRYQNKDGSLTAAGKKRRAKLENELNKLDGKKKSDSDDTPRKKSVSEMSTSELREHTDRMNAEKNYYDAKRNLANATPKQVSKGKKYAEAMFNEVLMPAAKNAGRQWLEKNLKEVLGLNSKEEVERTLDLASAYKNRSKLSDKQLGDAFKRATTERAMKKMLDEEEAAKKKAAEDKARESQERVKKEHHNETPNTDSSYYENSYRKTGGDRDYVNPNESRGMGAHNSTSKQGTVEGVGKNSKAYKQRSDTSTSSNDKNDVIDVEPYALVVRQKVNSDWGKTPVTDLVTTKTNNDYGYIKREKINGEWRYYYDEDEVN